MGPTCPLRLNRARLVEICNFLRNDPRLKFEILNDISGVDYLETDPKKVAKAGFEPHLEVVYHLSSFSFPGRRFTLKVVLARWKDDVVACCPRCRAWSVSGRRADWQERSLRPRRGQLIGHPGLVRILLGEDWVGHPLRKDYEFPLEYHGIRGR